MYKSLYIHIPFCRSFCPYCDFYSRKYETAKAAFFVDILLSQIKDLDFAFETIYIGGGTPTILSFHLWERLLAGFSRLAEKAKEFTIEANPDSFDESKMKLFSNFGVNRISLGCQSFNSDKLKFLKRLHTAKEVEYKVERLKKNGFKNISLDLMFGLPGETDKIWQKDLAKALELAPTHLSVYMLSYEEKTPLFRKLEKKDFLPLSNRKTALLYRQAIDYLLGRDFWQYEISNFAQKGFHSLHNFFYWKNEPYLGLGPSAVTFTGKERRKNYLSLAKYMKAVKKKDNTWDSVEELSDIERAKETAALKIRTSEGIDFVWFRAKTGFDFKKLFEKKVLLDLEKKDLIKFSQNKKKLFLTQKGILFADTVSSALL